MTTSRFILSMCIALAAGCVEEEPARLTSSTSEVNVRSSDYGDAYATAAACKAANTDATCKDPICPAYCAPQGVETATAKEAGGECQKDNGPPVVYWFTCKCKCKKAEKSIIGADLTYASVQFGAQFYSSVASCDDPYLPDPIPFEMAMAQCELDAAPTRLAGCDPATATVPSPEGLVRCYAHCPIELPVGEMPRTIPVPQAMAEGCALVSALD